MSTLNTINITNGTDSITVEGAVKGSAKAWVNFNGTGTVAIRASYNVSSITDNGTGDYTVNFTTALADANYSVVANGMIATNNAAFVFGPYTNAPSTTAVRFLTTPTTFASTDSQYVSVAIFR